MAAAGQTGGRLEFWTVDLLASDGGGLGQFDVLTVVDVLEHFPRGEGRELLGRLRYLLRPGGRMFLHVHIKANALDWLLVLKNGLLRERLRGQVLDHHGDPTHTTRYSVSSLSHLLRATGWETARLELRAYSPRLPNVERAVTSGHWGPLQRAQQQVVTDWDGVHEGIELRHPGPRC